ncbi:SDR family NAD(P)-dependent oxidoreductase [Candidatus Methylopumilus planktonicus]|nr:SDR family oxidoreductase [Candidatus Methylopumilus planktonicus]
MKINLRALFKLKRNMIDYGFKNKIALITGGSRGIGLSIAESLAKQGAHIIICSRSKENLESASKALKKHNVEVLTIKVDALKQDAADFIVSEIKKRWDGVDILINNVGGGGRWGNERVEITNDSVWSEVFQKNALIAALLTSKLIPHMLKRKWGRVITISSIYGKEGGGRPWFAMAKSAEVALMKSLSLTNYLVRSGITFNTVAPGGIYIKGAGFEEELTKNPIKFKKMIEDEYPLGRMGTPEEVANVVTFLCSEQASLVNGSQITVDGGQTKSF